MMHAAHIDKVGRDRWTRRAGGITFSARPAADAAALVAVAPYLEFSDAK